MCLELLSSRVQPFIFCFNVPSLRRTTDSGLPLQSSSNNWIEAAILGLLKRGNGVFGVLPIIFGGPSAKKVFVVFTFTGVLSESVLLIGSIKQAFFLF